METERKNKMQSNWISIKDKLPEEYRRVLVWVEGHGVIIDSYSFNVFQHVKTIRDAWA